MALDDLWIRHYETADEFLAGLSPLHGDWRTDLLPAWAFRGHGQASWPLIPSVLRVDAKTGKPRWHLEAGPDVAILMGTETYESARLQAERVAVMTFRDVADRAGLNIPEDSARFRLWREVRKVSEEASSPLAAQVGSVPSSKWPPIELVSLVALAQHFGIPTRLLDWSWKPRVAAYFAARDVRKNSFTGDLAVWAVNTFQLETILAHQEIPEVEAVHAAQATNRNLAGQAGLFTLARDAHEGVGLEDVLKRYCIRETQFELASLLRKLTLPASEARSLMARLAYEQVSAATVFPDYAGVVEAIDEADWWFDAP